MVSISCAFLWCCHDTPGFSIWNSSFRFLEVVIIRFKGHAFWLVRIWFLLFHIAQLVKASRATSFISSNAYLKISFVVCPRLASSHYHCGSEAQSTWTSEQKKKHESSLRSTTCICRTTRQGQFFSYTNWLSWGELLLSTAKQNFLFC